MPLFTRPIAQAETAAAQANSLAVHRCRFVDYNPSAITAVAFPPLKLPNKRSSRHNFSKGASKSRFGTLAVGRANGNIELYEWALSPDEQEHTPKAPQAWVLAKILYGPNPSKVDSIVFTLRHPHLLSYNEVPSLADLRLLSAGGGSELVEWDLATGSILRTLNSQGGAIWSMSANPTSTRLALGCEDGCVRLLDVADGELAHIRRFDRVKCRVLSIAWGPPVLPASTQRKTGQNVDESSDEDEEDEWTDTWLVTGGSDSSLRKWDARTGRVLDRMTTDKVRGERTLVWSVGVLADGTIVSGDSLGVVKFWDARTCTQLHSFPAHGADVLCLAVAPDGNSVFTSGVDQKVCLFTHVKISNADRMSKKGTHGFSSSWVHSTSKRMHSHDVRALAVWPPYLLISASARSVVSANPSPFSGIAPILASGGLDASLVLAPCATAGTGNQQAINPLATSAVSTFEDAYHRRLAYPTGLSPAVSVARSGRLIVCTQDTSMTVWRIIGRARVKSALETDLLAAQIMDMDVPCSDSTGLRENGAKEEDCGYEKLLEMELATMTNICSHTVSDDGRWLSVSDAYEVKLFELLPVENSSKFRPRRVKSLMSVLSASLSTSSTSTKEPEGASALGFTPDGSRLVLALARTARIIVVDLSDQCADGRPDPRMLRKFEHHARRGALFSRGRVVRQMPARVNGTQVVEDNDTDSDYLESEEDATLTETNAEGKMDVENGKKPEELSGDSDGDSADEDEDEHALVTRMAFSPDGQWLATTDDRRRTHIYNLDAVQHHTVLPTSPAIVTALAFSPSGTTTPAFVTTTSSSATLLVLAHSDATIGVYDVEARRFAPWASHLSQKERLPRRWANLHDGVLGIAVEPPSPSSPSNALPEHLPLTTKPAAADGGRHVVLWGATWLCRITLDAPVGWGGFVNKRRRDETVGEAKELSGENDTDAITNFKLVTRYRPILKADFLGPGELLVVERPLVDVLRGLPPAFFKPRYGT